MRITISKTYVRIVELMMNQVRREVMLSVALLRVRSRIHQGINHRRVRSNSNIGSTVVRLLHLVMHHLTITLL